LDEWSEEPLSLRSCNDSDYVFRMTQLKNLYWRTSRWSQHIPKHAVYM